MAERTFYRFITCDKKGKQTCFKQCCPSTDEAVELALALFRNTDARSVLVQRGSFHCDARLRFYGSKSFLIALCGKSFRKEDLKLYVFTEDLPFYRLSPRIHSAQVLSI